MGENITWTSSVSIGLTIAVLVYILGFFVIRVPRYWKESKKGLVHVIFIILILVSLIITTYTLSVEMGQLKSNNLDLQNQLSAITTTQSLFIDSIKVQELTPPPSSYEIESSWAIQTSQAGLLTQSLATQTSQASTIISMQATIDYQRKPTSTPTTADDAIKEVIKSYFELLSNNEIELAWNTFLTARIQKSIIDKYSREAYESYWEQREVTIIQFLELNFNFDRSDCWVKVRVDYNIDHYPISLVDSFHLVFQEEPQAWLINQFDEQELTN